MGNADKLVTLGTQGTRHKNQYLFISCNGHR